MINIIFHKSKKKNTVKSISVFVFAMIIAVASTACAVTTPKNTAKNHGTKTISDADTVISDNPITGNPETQLPVSENKATEETSTPDTPPQSDAPEQPTDPSTSIPAESSDTVDPVNTHEPETTSNPDNTSAPDSTSELNETAAPMQTEPVPVSTEEPETSETPEETEIPSSMELKKCGNMDYYLYSPANPTAGMPLIIYLHGGTNKRAETAALLTTEGFPKYLYDGYYGDLRAYIAVPKLDDSYKGWVNVYDQLRTLIKTIRDEYAIDSENIVLTGHSMGGTGTYQVQTKLSGTFARIAPMSGSIQNTDANIAALSKTKIWAFVGTNDTIVDPQSSRNIISALQAAGADAIITELEGATHFDVPGLAYKDPELISWLVYGD